MKHGWIVVVGLCLLVAGPAEARKRCKPINPPVEAGAEADAAWPHDANSGWVHAADDGWVHAADEGWVHDSGASWVHEDVDHAWASAPGEAWWAAVAEDASFLSEPESGPGQVEEEGALEHCWDDDRRNECVALTNQIGVYQFRLGLAQDREDALWEENLQQTIARLEWRGINRGCEGFGGPSFLEELKATIVVLAKALAVSAEVALMLYNMGLY